MTVTRSRWIRSSLADDRGTTAMLVAAGMVLFLGMAALTVDYGLGVNERRQDQASADIGVMAGALDAHMGEPGLRDAAMLYVRKNLENIYADPDWFASWASCTDPGKPPDFTPVPDVSGAGTYDCISVEDLGRLRIRVPDQLVKPAFARIVGGNGLTVAAYAEADIYPDGDDADVLPFGVLASAPAGNEVCLRSGALAVDPCTTSHSRNTRMVDSPLFGNPEFSTPRTCIGALYPVFATNVRLGVDHFIRRHSDGNPATEPFVSDTCGNFGPNRLESHSSVSETALWRGFFDGSLTTPSTPRLQQGGNPTRVVWNRNTPVSVDNRPLWDYIVAGYGGVAACAPGNFVDPDELINTANLGTCLQAAAAANARIFSTSVFNSPRLALVPEFYESSWPSGTGDRTIRGFRAVFIGGAFFNCSGSTPDTCGVVFYPGGDATVDLCDGTPPTCARLDNEMDQITAFLLHDNALPLDDLLEGASGLLGPFEPRLSG